MSPELETVQKTISDSIKTVLEKSLNDANAETLLALRRLEKELTKIRKRVKVLIPAKQLEPVPEGKEVSQ